MIGAVLLAGSAAPLGHLSTAGSWLSLLAKTLIGAVAFWAAQYAIWRLEGRPPGIERRLQQVLRRTPSARED